MYKKALKIKELMENSAIQYKNFLKENKHPFEKHIAHFKKAIVNRKSKGKLHIV